MNFMPKFVMIFILYIFDFITFYIFLMLHTYTIS